MEDFFLLLIPFVVIGVIIGSIFLIYYVYQKFKNRESKRLQTEMSSKLLEVFKDQQQRNIDKISNAYMVTIKPLYIQKIIESDDPLKETAKYLPRQVDLTSYKNKLNIKCLELLEKFNISNTAKSTAQHLVSLRISLIDEEQKANMIKIQDSMIPDNYSFLLGTINYDSISLNPLMDVADAMECKELEAAIYHYMEIQGYTTREVAYQRIKEIISDECKSIDSNINQTSIGVLVRKYKVLKMSSYIYRDYNQIRINPSVPQDIEKRFHCDKCGKFFTKTVKNMSEDSVTYYTKIAKEITELGHKAKVELFCDECRDDSKHNLYFSVTLNGFYYTHTSYPRLDYYGYYVGREYNYALKFLKGSYSVQDFNGMDVSDDIDLVLGMKKIEEIYEKLP